MLMVSMLSVRGHLEFEERVAHLTVRQEGERGELEKSL